MHLLVGRSVRYICFGVLFVCIFVASLTLYICSNQSCTFYKLNFFDSPRYAVRWHKLKANRRILTNNRTSRDFGGSEDESPRITVAKSDFNMRGSDVIVFLHIQNTGGSVFARHMVEDLRLERPCKCVRNRRVCRCYRPEAYGSTWFFSRYTTGWKCGVHPDWSQLSSCVDRVMDEDEGKPVKRRYFFITLLRDPVKRFLSEFWHVRGGRQSWPSTSPQRHRCGDVATTATDALPDCFEGEALGRLSLEAFLGCDRNPALNRQARMLSDLSLVGCHDNNSSHSEDRDLVLLTSAKNNLHKMSFFGLSEFPRISQYMFEATFGLRFKTRGASSRESARRRSARRELLREIRAKDVERVRRSNDLDVRLYHYARELLFFRLEKLKKLDPSFGDYLDVMSKSNVSSENWADREDFLLDNRLD